MDILKLRDAITEAIDKTDVKGDTPEENFCVSVDFSKFKHSIYLAVRFQSDTSSSTIRFDRAFGSMSVRIFHDEGDIPGTSIEVGLEEIRNNFKKMGVEFNGEYL